MIVQELKMEKDPLQTPFKLSSHKLEHRVVLAPMTRMRASDTGIIHPRAAEYYSERTTPNSLLISEGVVIHPRGRGFPNTPGLYNNEQVQAWKPITQAVREKGGVFFAQLWQASLPSLHLIKERFEH
jgi:2,4-dienoyl-CoA reductase-like NADH-dependent reductase (Old Yellow Enzyme family)